jgi:FAD-binding domain/Ferric reductase NAD binding domain
MTIALSGFHFPHIGWWCWISLGLWIGERLWRFSRFGWINGYFLRPRAQPPKGEQAWEMDDRIEGRHWSPHHASTDSKRFDTSIHADHSKSLLPKSSTSTSAPAVIPGNGPIPPGYGWAYLLPGRTIRLRVVTPRPIYWSPGQHVLLRVPSVSQLTTHPFTIASISHILQKGATASVQVVELLVRAKGGFTRDLWNEVYRLSNLPRNEAPLQPTIGALLKVQLDGPFGSVSRTRWGNFSTILIICGGSGVSFGIAILEFLCLCMSGQKPSTLGSSPGGLGYSNFRTRRVRFVWLVREYCEFLISSECLQQSLISLKLICNGVPPLCGAALECCLSMH